MNEQELQQARDVAAVLRNPTVYALIAEVERCQARIVKLLLANKMKEPAMDSGISKTEAQSAIEIRQAVSQAVVGSDLSKVIAWLKAMGQAIADTASATDVDKAYRALGLKILTDTTLRDKYYAKARKAGLI